MKNRFGQVIFVSLFIVFILATQIIGQVFFINQTKSMPVGIYMKSSKQRLKTGDTIIFNDKFFKGNLIKNIIATFGQKCCFDELGNFWVDENLVAQKNTKYKKNQNLNHPQCQVLLPDEIMVLGEHPDSYDSRYFGPIRRDQIIASVKLLWQFGSGQ